jgi:hypothetical protein
MKLISESISADSSADLLDGATAMTLLMRLNLHGNSAIGRTRCTSPCGQGPVKDTASLRVIVTSVERPTKIETILRAEECGSKAEECGRGYKSLTTQLSTYARGMNTSRSVRIHDLCFCSLCLYISTQSWPRNGRFDRAQQPAAIFLQQKSREQ